VILRAKRQIFGVELHIGDHKPGLLLPECLTPIQPSSQTC
jgi:hypothetical protein